MPQKEFKIRAADKIDREKVFAILEATEFFRPEELLIAQEVFDSSVNSNSKDGYISYVAQIDNIVVGWICFGQTPCTCGTFDIYWIAVDPARQNQGIGRQLILAAEKKIKQLNGRLIAVDTSGTERYNPSRSFYEKNGYINSACLENFYNTGDSKVIYLKKVI